MRRSIPSAWPAPRLPFGAADGARDVFGSWVVRLLAPLVLLLATLACGKRGDPLPPLSYAPAATQDLKIQQVGEELLLTLSYPTTTLSGLGLAGIEEIEIYRMELSLSLPAADSAADSEAVEDSVSAEAAEATESTAEPEAVAEAQATDEPQATEDPEAEDGSPSLPAIERGVFQRLASLIVTIEAAELAAATSGDRIALRLPLAPLADNDTSLLAFSIRTTGGGKRSPLSNIATLVPQPPIPPPSSFQLRASRDGIDITWTSDADELAGFNLYRRYAGERLYGTPLSTVEADLRSYLDITAVYGNRYVYAVRAVASAEPLIESGFAGEQEIDYRDRFAPSPPQNLLGLSERRRIQLLWDPNEEDDVAGYLVYRREPGGDFRRLYEEPLARLAFLDEAATSGLTYGYRITAVDESGNESIPSAEISATAQ